MKLKTLGSVLLTLGLALAFLSSFNVPSAHAQSISNSVAATATSSTVISLNLSPLKGDAIVVFEWFGSNLNPCSFILPPTDAQSQTWGAVGACQVDTGGVAAMRAFSVASYSSNVPDTVNCNFGGPNTNIEACYVFDVASPGIITLIGSANGYGQNIQLPGNPSTALPNSLIFAMAGIDFNCQSVNVGSGFNPLSPPSACNANPYGLSGEWIQAPSGGISSNFPMSVSQNVVWAELVVQVSQPAVTTTTTIYTATIVAWLVPDATHFANALMLIILPLGGMCSALIPFTMFQRPREIGDKAIYPALFGFTAGSALADLSVNGTSQLQVPFAFLLTGAVLLFLWWWNS